jgi:RNA polymerase sigma-70 factor (ECF subfamily)
MTDLSTATSSVGAAPTLRDLEVHRTALKGHCYRMLGSASEADDAVQETMVRAWRALARFEGRSSLRTWLYRIATRVCLDALSARTRRAQPMDLHGANSIDDPFPPEPEVRWLEPIPDAEALPVDADPSELLALRQSIRLAFVAALQHLPPKQRAALILAEVLGWAAAEIADCLETTVPAVNSALQRARATLAARDLDQARAPLSPAQIELVDLYVDAFERYDIDTLTHLLHQDATLSMPPYSFWLRGRDDIGAWLRGRGGGCRGSRLLPTTACGSPAFGQYRQVAPGRHEAWSLVVLEFDGDKIAAWNAFLDVGALFPRFGLPLVLSG